MVTRNNYPVYEVERIKYVARSRVGVKLSSDISLSAEKKITLCFAM
jgi:hypothetical protein